MHSFEIKTAAGDTESLYKAREANYMHSFEMMQHAENMESGDAENQLLSHSLSATSQPTSTSISDTEL